MQSLAYSRSRRNVGTRSSCSAMGKDRSGLGLVDKEGHLGWHGSEVQFSCMMSQFYQEEVFSKRKEITFPPFFHTIQPSISYCYPSERGKYAGQACLRVVIFLLNFKIFCKLQSRRRRWTSNRDIVSVWVL